MHLRKRPNLCLARERDKNISDAITLADVTESFREKDERHLKVLQRDEGGS